MSTTHPVNRTTEWYDIQAKYGNYDPLPPEIKAEEVSQKLQEIVEEYDPLAEKSLEQLQSLEDNIEEDILQAHRRKRLEELKAKRAKAKFGSVIEISKQEYVDEVTNGSKNGQYVLCLLYKEYMIECQILMRIWDQLARTHPETKFVRGVSDKVVPEYKDESLPAILVYRDGKCQSQVVGLSLFGTPSTVTRDKVEWIMARRMKIFETDQSCSPFEPDEGRRQRGTKGVIARMGLQSEDSEFREAWRASDISESSDSDGESAGEINSGAHSKGYGNMALDSLASRFARC